MMMMIDVIRIINNRKKRKDIDSISKKIKIEFISHWLCVNENLFGSAQQGQDLFV